MPESLEDKLRKTIATLPDAQHGTSGGYKALEPVEEYTKKKGKNKRPTMSKKSTKHGEKGVTKTIKRRKLSKTPKENDTSCKIK